VFPVLLDAETATTETSFSSSSSTNSTSVATVKVAAAFGVFFCWHPKFGRHSMVSPSFVVTEQKKPCKPRPQR